MAAQPQVIGKAQQSDIAPALVLAVRRGGAGAPNPKLVWLYDNVVVPTTRTAERVVRPPFGQSVLCVVRVPA